MTIEIPTVTKIIEYCRGEKLKKWRERNKTQSRENKRRGNNLHNLVELYFKNELLDPKDTGNEYFDKLIPILSRYENVKVEMPVFYLGKSKPYKGRIDLFDEKTQTLIEIKTRANSKRELHPEALKENFAQLGAYVMALEYMGIEVFYSLVLVCYPDKEPTLYSPDMKKYKNYFHSMLDKYYAHVSAFK